MQKQLTRLSMEQLQQKVSELETRYAESFARRFNAAHLHRIRQRIAALQAEIQERNQKRFD